MIAELGHFALILAFCLACFQVVIPMMGAISRNSLWMASARSLAAGQFVFAVASFAILVKLFLDDDWSVNYVAANSNSLLPGYYKISAVWGAHEGSLLLWVLILSGWTVAVALFSKSLPLGLVARVISVMGMVSVGFYLFLLLTSNPFLRTLPFPSAEGADLNPLLQDFGLIVHPPMLYMGYVGFSVAFAFAVAALLEGRVDTAWARWTRPWTNIAWMFLTVGIALGSWWAYYELGWGGWWFWDPVENASFMPWLVGTALVHSLAVSEKRGGFRSWTLLLAIFSFSLSLLGTFLVRSGVLTSVHAFASDPERGVFILVFLALVVGGSLTLFGLKGQAVKGVMAYNGFSREVFLLLNNILLVTAAAIILLGTLYPLIADVMEWGKVSVGPPYFNLFFVPLMIVLACLMALAPLLQWKRNRWAKLQAVIPVRALLSLTAGGLFALIYPAAFSWIAALSVSIGSWVVLLCAEDFRRKLRNATSLAGGLRKLGGSFFGMHIAHVGLAVSLMGVGLTTAYNVQYDKRLVAGDQLEIAGLSINFGKVSHVAGPNYVADQGNVKIYKGERLVAHLKPQKRRYLASGQVMTEAAIDAGFFRDIYVSLAEPLKEGAWAVRIYHKPFVRWIWLGALMIAFGSLLATLDKRYRLSNKAATQASGSRPMGAQVIPGAAK